MNNLWVEKNRFDLCDLYTFFPFIFPEQITLPLQEFPIVKIWHRMWKAECLFSVPCPLGSGRDPLCVWEMDSDRWNLYGRLWPWILLASRVMAACYETCPISVWESASVYEVTAIDRTLWDAKQHQVKIGQSDALAKVNEGEWPVSSPTSRIDTHTRVAVQSSEIVRL